MKNRNLHILLLILLSVPICVAQNRFLTYSGDSSEIGIGFSMENVSFNAVNFAAGFTIEDFIFLGLIANLNFTSQSGNPAQELVSGFNCKIAVIQQDDIIPLSSLIFGQFLKKNVISDSLQESDLIKTASGFSAGIEIYRDFALGNKINLRLGLGALYSSDNYVTEPEAGLSDSSDRIFEKENSYKYGIDLAVSILLTEKLLLTTEIDIDLNNEFKLEYGLDFYFTALKVPLIFNENSSEISTKSE